MAYRYHKLQQWNAWLAKQPLGQSLSSIEEKKFAHLLNNQFGKFAMLLGVPLQHAILNSLQNPCQYLMTSLSVDDKHKTFITVEPHELPLFSGSIDVVILPHVLEFVENPRQLLLEASRVVKPEGIIAISGFNPYSAWGLKKLLFLQSSKRHAPWNGNFISSTLIKKWLRLADFQIEKQANLFVLPCAHVTLATMTRFETLGNLFFPFLGGVYIVLARAKVIPVTPIRLKWKQQLSGIRISPPITRSLTR